MTTKIFTFASAKGGSGKTTLTATLGTFLSELGYSVLLVDCDEATNGLTLLYIDAVNEYPVTSGETRAELNGVFDEYDEQTRVADVVGLQDNLSLCPAVFMFDRQVPFTGDRFRQRIRAIIEDAGQSFDYVILDAQAGADQISLACMAKDISDLVVIVSEYDPLSAAGVERLKGIAPDALSFDRTWVLLNKMLPEFVESFSEFLSVSHYLPPLPWTADVVRAYARRELALDFDGGNEFTLAVLQTVRGLPLPGLKQKIERWVTTKADIIRQPVDTQYDDTEAMLRAVTLQIRELTAQRDRRKGIYALAGRAAGAFIATLALGVALFQAGWFTSDSPKFELVDFAVLVAAASIAFPLMVLVERFAGRLGDLGVAMNAEVNSEIELERLERQRQLYLEKLRELEFLKSADAAELLEERFSS